MQLGQWWPSTWGRLGLGPRNTPRGSQLCALYDFTYTATDGRQVSMAEGDRFQLLRKTNSDWWLARRLGAPSNSRPIFVPAAYMTEESVLSPSPTTVTTRQSLQTHGKSSLSLPYLPGFCELLEVSSSLLIPSSYLPVISLLLTPIMVFPLPLFPVSSL